jgi:PKD repeat protein
MKINLTCLLLAGIPFLSFAQSTISGIINHYAKVIAVDYCSGKLTLSDASSFTPGEKVLLMQMQGAEIDPSNTGSFGNIINPGSAGLFEKNEIMSKNGSDIFLKNTILNTYNVAGSLQLVSMPVFSNATVTGNLKPAFWNGATGGVLAFEVENELILLANVDVSGAGFGGGAVNVVNSDCSFLSSINDYFYNSSNWRGAEKGEGIAAFIVGKEWGRGAQANGGGGGNDHNSGGGGGGNASNGGVGGKQTPSSAFGCFGDFPGRGGRVVPAQGGRVFMGGGGGAGHTDDAGAGSAGGNGGGIVILVAGSIVGNGYSILANGGSPQQASGDGAGGGGAGGTIVLQTGVVPANLTIEAKGGNGGNVSNALDRCFGPGGGGSGGRLLTNITGLPAVQLSGGVAGFNLTNSGLCNGVSNEATAGGVGVQNMGQAISASTEEIAATLVKAGFTYLPLENGQYQFENTSKNATGFSWNFGDGGTSQEENPVHTYLISGTYTVTLTAVNGCGSDIFAQEIVVNAGQAPQPDFIANAPDGCVPLTVQFQNQSTGTNLTGFNWLFEGGTPPSSYEEDPVILYNYPGKYSVTLTVVNALGENTSTKEDFILAEPVPQADFSFTVNGQTVTFTNLSEGGTNYFWLFGDGSSSATENPVHFYQEPGIYDVSLSATNSNCGSAISYQVFLSPTSAHETSPERLVACYPNPVQDKLTVILPETDFVKKTAFLWDMQGRMVKTYEANQPQIVLDFSPVTKGVYCLEIAGHRIRIVKI